VSADRPDRPGVAALIAELEVRRHVRTAVIAGIGFAALVFLLFAYLPGTDESLLYWGSLTVVLAFAVGCLVAGVLVGRAAYRRTLSVNGIEPGRRSPTTLAAVLGLLGWVIVPVVATLAVEIPGEGFRLTVALLTSGFVVLVVGSLGLKLVAALSLSHVWRPLDAAVGAVAYTALVALPAVGCPSGGPCLGTPNRLVAAVLALDPTLVSSVYAGGVLVGGLLIGFVLGLRGAAPPHGFFAGVVASMSTLIIVAATTADPTALRSTALYLPILLGTTGALGGAVAVVTGGNSTERSHLFPDE
jgi:hypothetical protein